MPHSLFDTYQSFDTGFGKKAQFYSLPQLQKVSGEEYRDFR